MADTFPSWRYGPKGEAKICETADDVPPGWADHPSKAKAPKEAPARGNRK